MQSDKDSLQFILEDKGEDQKEINMSFSEFSSA